MGKWLRLPCEACDETGKICDVCGGHGTVDCDCEDCDDCSKCHGSSSFECTECVQCADCEGKGYQEEYIDECPECDGGGTVECDCTGGLGSYAADDDCPACGGDGTHICPVCEGTGYDLDDLRARGVDIRYL